MCHIHPIYAFFYWDCTRVQHFRAIEPLFMEILHFEDLGDTSVVSECSLGVNLVIDNFVYVASDSSPRIFHLCIKFESNRTITYGDIAVWRFGDTSVVSECSLGVNLVIDICVMYLQVLHLCIKFESNRTISYGDIAFWGFGGYECRLAANAVVLVLGGYQISIAKYLRGVSTLK